MSLYNLFLFFNLRAVWGQQDVLQSVVKVLYSYNQHYIPLKEVVEPDTEYKLKYFFIIQ